MELDNKIEYKLKFLLNSMTLKHIETKEILDKDKVKEFTDANCNSMKAQLFCQKIEDQTFFPAFGVPVGKDSTVHTVYLCEVAFGDSLFVVRDFVEEKLPIPEGFDSLVTDMQSEQKYLSDTEQNIGNFFYVINDKSKILPLYEVTFEYDAEFEKNARNKNICHKCQKQEAIVYCPSERASFCDECDQVVHADAFLKRHERKYFKTCGQSKFINCFDHATKTIEYYCIDCAEPICSYCKVTGSHSQPERAGHKIISFVEACESLSKDIKSSSEPLVGYSERIYKEIEKLHENSLAFRENIKKVRFQIDKEYKNLCLQLEAIENNKVQTMNANYLEILRQAVQFEQMKKFPDEMDPTDRLEYYKAIKNQRQMEHYAELTVESFVPTQLVGKLQIKTPKNTCLRVTNSVTSEKSVQMRIEAQNQAKK
ncbi:TRI36 [Enterospora canceri]|uniref:TRI36 n=1 Tax=Enterospora canceri TaxID=1081671 RepID=A0A1Y1S668_9MICR|nr:TRI36 [Enterospora canceri]